MRLTLALVAAMLAGVTVGACGRSHSTAPSATATALDDGDLDGTVATSNEQVGNGADDDADSEGSTTYYDWDDGNVLFFGHPASAHDASAMTGAVTSYYASSARADALGVCNLLSRAAADAFTSSYGHALNLPRGGHRGCPAVMTALLRDLHRQLQIQSSTLRTGVARVDGTEARLLLSFDGHWPSRFMSLVRERSRWKIAGLTASALP